MAIEELFLRRFLVLCGEPASGKTQTLKHFLASTVGALNFENRTYIEFRNILTPDQFVSVLKNSPAFKKWESGIAPLQLIIDGVDEGIVKIGHFLPLLITEIKNTTIEQRARLQLVLACRTLDWEPHLGRQHELGQLLGLSDEDCSKVVFTLCPLTWQNAFDATQKAKLEPKSFLSEVHQHGLQGLAAFPFTLKMLLREFSKGSLRSKSRREFYDNFAVQLCADAHDNERRYVLRVPPIIAPARVLNAAKFLAVLVIAAGGSAIFTGRSDDAEATDLKLDEIKSVLPIYPGSDLPIAMELDCALSTGIFTDRGRLRYGFIHQTMAESLAALAFSQMPFAQLRSLFFRQDSQGLHIVPQLAQTASWLAELHDEFRRQAIHHDPVALLRSDIRRIPNSQKVEVIEALLTWAASGRLSPQTRLYLAGLAHSNVRSQLLPTLLADTSDLQSCELVLNIIQESNIASMIDDVWTYIRRKNISGRLRVDAASALCELLVQTEPLELLALLNEDISGKERHQDIRGLVLTKLVPRHLSVRQALQYLVPTENDNFTDAFDSFLTSIFPKYITIADVAASLRYLNTHPGWCDRVNRLNRFASEVLTLALKNLQDKDISCVLSELWIRYSKDHQLWMFGKEEGGPLDIVTKDLAIRRQLASTLILSDALNADKLSTQELQEIFFFPSSWLVTHDDLFWLLEFVENCESRQQTKVKAVLRTALGFYHNFLYIFRNNSDELLAFLCKHGDIKAALPWWFEPWGLDEERSRKAKEENDQHEEMVKQSQINRLQRPDWHSEISNLLQRAKVHPSWWARIWEILDHGPDWKRDPDSGELPGFRGWDFLSAEERKLAKDAARQFIIQCTPGRLHPGHYSNFEGPAILAVRIHWAGIHDDSVMADALRKKWIHVLMRFHWGPYQFHPMLRSLAYRLAPSKTLRSLRTEVIDDAKRDSGIVAALNGFEQLCDKDIASMLWRIIKREEINPRSINDIASFIAENSSTYFLVEMSKAGFRPKLKSSPADTLASLLGVCLKVLPLETWDPVFCVLGDDLELAKKTIWYASGLDMLREKNAFAKVSSDRLAKLYIFMDKLYPVSEDLPFGSEHQGHYSRYSVSRFRDSLVNCLTSRADEAACRELWKLAQQFPDRRYSFLWSYHQALQNYRISEWMRPAPLEVAELIRDKKNRWIRTSTDLLELVCESLSRLQARISKSSNPRLDEFWDVGGTPQKRNLRGPKSEEDISSQIAAWIQEDLAREAGVIGREVVPRHGQRTDITIEAPNKFEDGTVFPKVIIELKGNWNADVKSAIKSQLAEGYLAGQQGAVGLYLVAWFGADPIQGSERLKQNRLESASFQGACHEIGEYAQPYDGARQPYIIRGAVLNFERC